MVAGDDDAQWEAGVGALLLDVQWVGGASMAEGTLEGGGDEGGGAAAKVPLEIAAEVRGQGVA